MSRELSFRYLFESVLKYRAGVIQLIILQFLWLLMELSVPFMTQSIADKGIVNQDIDFIFVILLSLFFIFLSNLSSDFFRTRLLRHIGIRVNTTMLNLFLFRLIYKKMQFWFDHKESELNQLVTDNFRIEKFLTDGAAIFIDSVLRILLFGIVLFTFSAQIGITFFVAVGLSVVWDVFFLGLRERNDNIRFKVSAQIRKEISEIVAGIKDIKVNNLEQQRMQGWALTQDFFSRSRLQVMTTTQYYKSGIQVLDQLRYIIIIFLTAATVMKGSLTIGALLAVQYILGQLSRNTMALMQFIQDYHETKISLDRLAKIVNLEELEYIPTTKEASFVNKAQEITYQQVAFSYGKFPCLKNINFSVPYGSSVAIVGESGSGKSTILQTILQLLQPQEGEIRVGKRLLTEIPTDEWRSTWSVVLQDGFIFNKSIRFNITLLDDDQGADETYLHEIIRSCCLEDLVARLGNGVQTLVGTDGESLSKGQMQRILIARAWYKNGAYLLMDEPTSALDPITANTVFNNTLNAFKEKTIVFTTHNLKLAEMADLIIVIDNGNIIEQGTHQALIENNGHYSNLYRLW
jgi:ATP-binding cassette, subfamily B, bacterial